MRVAIAQINPALGDFRNNRLKIQEFAEQARAENAEMVVFPECALFGYPPKDTLESAIYVDQQLKQFEQLVEHWKYTEPLIVGLITRNDSLRGKPFFNSAAIIQNAGYRLVHKSLLPSYDVFDETRYVESSLDNMVASEINGKKVLVTICEDIWGWPLGEGKNARSDYRHNPLEKIHADEVDLVVNISASPFSKGQEKERLQMASRTAQSLQAPLVYVNAVGAQDELIFDGASFALDRTGQYQDRCTNFVEQLKIVDLSKPNGDLTTEIHRETAALYHALVLGIRDFVTKIGLKKVHLGLSGGIDSAVVAALAAAALTKQNVALLALPTRFNSDESFALADKLASNLGCQLQTVEIDSIYQKVTDSLQAPLELSEMSVTHENLQSRIRGLILMAYSNRHSSMLLTTGNKSEYATGYATLYGDMCGGLAPIADLLKSEVYELARYINRDREIIPQRIIDRPPSAELRPDQRDDQSLPPYDELDAAVEKIVEHKATPQSETERFVAETLLKTEFKRWQAPPVLRVSKHAFGRGRRLPIANNLDRQ